MTPEPLKWWRRGPLLPPRPRGFQQLQAALKEVHPEPVPGFWQAIEAGESALALAEGLRLLEEAREESTGETNLAQDIAVSFALLAQQLGNATLAALVLAQALHERAFLRTEALFFKDPRPFPPGLLDLFHRADQWLDALRLETPETRERLASELEALDRAFTTLAQESEDSHPTLEVAKTIATNSRRRDDEIVQRYKPLTKPLPLRGGEIDLGDLEQKLRAEFPWMAAATQAVIRDLWLRWMGEARYFHVKPLLLLGPPGIGKTRFCRRLSELTGIQLRIVSGAGASHAHDLLGLSRIFDSTQPSAAALAMLAGNLANPLVLIDEVEKAGGSDRHGRFHDALLQLLEPENAKRFPDECLGVPMNLSAVSWILTANTLDRLTPPLLDRVEIVTCERPGRRDFPRILESLQRDLERDYALEPGILPALDPETRSELERLFLAGASLRDLRRRLRESCVASLRARAVH